MDEVESEVESKGTCLLARQPGSSPLAVHRPG